MHSATLDWHCPTTTELTHLLLLDNHEDRAQICDLIEQELGWQITATDGFSSNVAWLEHEYPHIVLTAVRVDGCTGTRLIEHIRGQVGDVPIVLLTGDGDDRAALKALQAGATSFVPRELIASDLIETLSRILATAQMQTRRRRLNMFLQCCDIEFELNNDPTMIAPLIAALQEQLAIMGVCTEKEMLRLGVALEEALLNGIHHGNLEVSSELRQTDGERAFFQAIETRRHQSPYCDRRLHVHARITRNEGTIVVRDEGPGFDVANLPDPTDPENLTRVGGRGVLLMRTFMDEVIYNARGNEVTLVKRRTTHPNA